MVDDNIVHANTKTRGTHNPILLGCGAVRTRGVQVTGNMDIVTCPDCLGTSKSKTSKEEKEV